MSISKSLRALLVLAIPILIAAESTLKLEARQGSQCNAGTLLCCDQVTDASSVLGKTILTMLTIPGDLLGLIGLSCTPISVIGVSSGTSCAANPVCCTNNSFNGVVALGCTPVNLNL